MNPTRRDEPRLLILETSGRVGRIALAEGSKLGAICSLDEARRHARDLAPGVAELCAARGWKVRDLDAVIVSRGPGSYTGLRVGIMSAKVLAYATGCVVLGIQTFAAIASQAPAEATDIDVLADAQQQNVYAQRWTRADAGWTSQRLTIRPGKAWLDALAPGVWVTGPGLAIFEAQIPAANTCVPLAQREPEPASLLTLGLERWRRGDADADDPWTLEPLYLRPSNAEENWAKRRGNSVTG